MKGAETARLLVAEQESHAGWAAMFAGLIFMAASRFEDVQEIGLASFRMKLFERRVDQLGWKVSSGTSSGWPKKVRASP